VNTVIVNVDGHNLNASHFGAMSAEEGPKRIIADGFTKEEAWAKRAHALCVAAVTPKAEASKPEAKAPKK
jgi:hypothetical protein